MRVKDLIKELQGLDPETVVSGVRYLEKLPWYYDGETIDVLPDDNGDNIIEYNMNDKIYFHNYSLDDLVWDCEGDFDKAYLRIKFVDASGRYDILSKKRILEKLKSLCDKCNESKKKGVCDELNDIKELRNINDMTAVEQVEFSHLFLNDEPIANIETLITQYGNIYTITSYGIKRLFTEEELNWLNKKFKLD